MKTNNQNPNGQDPNLQADEQILKDLQSGGNNTQSSKGILPQVEVIEGVITKVDLVEPKDGNPFYLITVGSDTKIVVNKSTMLRGANKSILSEGNVIVATCEKRVPGKTGYKDTDGKWKLHKGQGGLSLNDVTQTEAKAQKTADLRDKLTEQRELNGLAVDKADQLAQIMKRYVGDDPMALATALAGLANVK